MMAAVCGRVGKLDCASKFDLCYRYVFFMNIIIIMYIHVIVYTCKMKAILAVQTQFYSFANGKQTEYN